MKKQPLHITNGGSLTKYLNQLEIVGEKLTWQEILCEGPTHEDIYNDQSIQDRKTFLKTFYDLDLDIDKVNFALEQLENPKERYNSIVLWFEYDLFCHINMLAVINLLRQLQIELPIYLVCSGKISESTTLKGLTQLTPKQLKQHYKRKIHLTTEAIELATTLWRIYCGRDHNLFKPYIVQTSLFPYLSNCLKAHLERFPDTESGLNTLEMNILKLVQERDIKSKHHLLGYALNYQGFYGYGDLQMRRIINKLDLFLTVSQEAVTLNSNGLHLVSGNYNAIDLLKTPMVFGGVKKSKFRFSKSKNKLIKATANAN